MILFRLVMLVMVHGHTQAYVLDHHLTRDDCAAMLEMQPAYHVRKAKVQVDFICERQP